MKEKIRHLIAEKLIQKGLVKMSLHRMTEAGNDTDEELNILLDRLQRLDEEIKILERVLKQLKQ
ncbi:transposase [Dyadobacter sp. BE34]|uniref:Transposase n=1 Tax=Dyadobacter fermentans TaxID=94254 RepID=A0ABU1R4A6_9BACT|nr:MULTISPECIES: hypothetical protein [Dyadobacter]MDR6808234.1 transposase [Dyadobacter fermentans]MDR7045950.1 transposase [Dyadobacter sp. BE242]MDR7200263.1 transposase [Dyadobacter sp. BE34]MDR7218223.1 transposase [Dyadobacter sp. BE31]MDR7266154.1 transposase [Dyadobacter sp. BE32]